MDISRQAYYKQRHGEQRRREQARTVVGLVTQTRLRQPRMGTRKIVGYHVHDSLQTERVRRALEMALSTRNTRQHLVHHSDRGIQYCSSYYQDLHRRHGITCLMTDGYDCYQNALAERINGILKTEFLITRPTDWHQAAKMVRESVLIYNQEPPHSALEYKTPDEVHRALIRQYQPIVNRPS